jgi:hypothetical protein
VAEQQHHRALAIVRRQRARVFELRAAIDLARLWRDQDKRTEARDLLAPVYNWFDRRVGHAGPERRKGIIGAAHRMSEVRNGLEGIGLGPYAETFEANDIL